MRDLTTQNLYWNACDWSDANSRHHTNANADYRDANAHSYAHGFERSSARSTVCLRG